MPNQNLMSEAIFGLGECISSGFIHNSSHTIQTMGWIDIGDPIDSNYENHPVALVHRLNGTTASTHAMGITDQHRANRKRPPRDAMDRHRHLRRAARLHRLRLVAPGHGHVHRLAAQQPILDAAIPLTMIASDVYVPATSSAELGLFLKNAGGDDYIGQVWPGASKFPDFLTPTTQYWWTASLMVWQEILPSDGLWLDMNEPSSFCDAVPGVGEWPEGYNYDISGTSGNFSVNRTTAFNASLNATVIRRSFVLESRKLNASNSTLNTTRMNGGGPNDPALRHPQWCVSVSFLSSLTDEPRTDLSASAELYVDNGFSAPPSRTRPSRATELRPAGRCTTCTTRGATSRRSAGRVTGHWTGDNYSKWLFSRQIVQGALQFALYGIPMTGSDTCGFNGNSDEELCNRWMQAAFLPFFCSHNTVSAIGRDSVAYASRIAISARYALLPFIYTQLATRRVTEHPPPAR
ncbi:glycoside hydrolase family 31 protein, partial [Athelia psychrophila]